MYVSRQSCTAWALAARWEGDTGPMTDAPQAPADAALLIEAVARGDRTAFAALFKRFAPRIKALLMRRGSAPAEAEELAQEAMLAVWRKAGQFDPARATGSAWIFAIARNLHIDRHRRVRAMADLDPAFESEPPAPSDTILGEAERAMRVHEALAALPSDQAAVLRLAFFDQRTQSEMGTILGIPLGTVKSRLRLAMGRLRAALGDLA
jgi:RNA polymerase sigma-70 factor, ECF subfamily